MRHESECIHCLRSGIVGTPPADGSVREKLVAKLLGR
jgi:hypothetical protein